LEKRVKIKEYNVYWMRTKRGDHTGSYRVQAANRSGIGRPRSDARRPMLG
jgi:hypothetical protein